MSDKVRIKQLRTKTQSSTYTAPIPFGTDGSLVDMFSGLDLEEQIRLGSQFKTTMEQGATMSFGQGLTGMKITEYFENKNPNSDFSYYRVVSEICDQVEQFIIVTVENDNAEYFLSQLYNTDPNTQQVNYILNEQDLNDYQATIKVTLSKRTQSVDDNKPLQDDQYWQTLHVKVTQMTNSGISSIVEEGQEE